MASYLSDERSWIASAADVAVVTTRFPERSRIFLVIVRSDGSSSTQRTEMTCPFVPEETILCVSLLVNNNSCGNPSLNRCCPSDGVIAGPGRTPIQSGRVSRVTFREIRAEVARSVSGTGMKSGCCTGSVLNFITPFPGSQGVRRVGPRGLLRSPQTGFLPALSRKIYLILRNQTQFSPLFFEFYISFIYEIFCNEHITISVNNVNLID